LLRLKRRRSRREDLPSQQQLRWSQLRVGITVIVAVVILAILIFLMNSTGGIFTKKITLRAYFDNASGLREGAPVRLEGVDIGNVTGIRIVTDPSHTLAPVEVIMKVNTRYHRSLHKDSTVTMSTAGVLGETFVDINSRAAKGPEVADGDVLNSEQKPDLQDMVKAGQTMLQNVQALLVRVDHIVAFVESGQGSAGKFLKDPALFDRMNQTLAEVQKMVNDISSGKGSVGKLLRDDEMYNKVNASVDKLDKIIDEINQGKGSAGKFLKDEQLYNNLNQTAAKANKLMDDVNNGKGTIGLLAKDQEFAAKVNNTMAKVNDLITRLDAGEGSAGKLMRDPSLYTNADQMLVETRNLVKAIRENPKKYLTIHFRIF
jgi:phospholipid/cholesterol/gamma-HCH transport system substrate-binding protein